MQYLTGVYWDVGEFRRQNQDSILLLQTLTGRGRIVLAAVCDGMGGHDEGAVMSALVTRALQEWYYEFLVRACYKRKRIWVIQRALDRLLYHLQEKIRKDCENREIETGTTLSVLVLLEGKYLLWHLGDSRIYRFGRKRCVEALTTDHVTEDGRLTKCVGSFGFFVPDHRYGVTGRGNSFLLCSDGFFRRTAIGELGEVLAPEEIQTEEQIRRRLREIADCDRRRGERDNISAVYIKVR